MRTILNVVGARPNFMKMAPIHRRMLEHDSVRPILVHTGQHYDARMSQTFFSELGMPEPDRFLGVGSGTHAEQTGAVMIALEKLLLEIKPDLVVVAGDVNSTLAAALAAAKLYIPIAHVEAGLRSMDRTMPEEINRILTDALARWLFITEQSGWDHLRAEGVPAHRMYFVGNVMIDSLSEHLEKARISPIMEELQVQPGEFALVTLHRPSNVDNPVLLDTILTALETLQQDLRIVFPVHPRTEKMLVQYGFGPRFAAMKNLLRIAPLGYLAFLRLMSAAAYLLTDSGGIQEETTWLNVPCLTLRESTERPITVTLGSNRLVPLQSNAIIEHAAQARAGRLMRKRIPPLWDGRASERIVNILLS
ncbi:MAG TPA: UDP-N-acetylglucosamine 2-epimerase (non-hydrolyzing) [bacterium]|nr:UDP-N-acetylglucosamine 2-epimerase (non-hydrolyzing) [bacterium]